MVFMYQINCNSASSCRLSNSTALGYSIVMTIPISVSLPKPIVRTTPINGRSLKAVAPTIPIYVNHQKSIVQAIIELELIDKNRLPAQFQSTSSLRAHLSGQVQLFRST